MEQTSWTNVPGVCAWCQDRVLGEVRGKNRAIAMDLLAGKRRLQWKSVAIAEFFPLTPRSQNPLHQQHPIIALCFPAEGAIIQGILLRFCSVWTQAQILKTNSPPETRR